jgi:glyoxylase-like metal-dependent hydrolase (beta-lactamase superfamily II)
MTNSTFEQPLPASRERQAARAHGRNGQVGRARQAGPARVRAGDVIPVPPARQVVTGSHEGEIAMLRATRCAVLPSILILGLVSVAAAQQTQPAPPTRAIVNVTGQLYRAQNNNHYTVFLVTPQGVIMSDPINRDFARWLKAEIATRFKVPVRYVLYTHRDWDHASGGVVFADTAEFVGHVNMLKALAPPAGNPPLTAEAVKMDGNRNGLVERGEAGGAIAERFAQFDFNGDNVVSGAEIARGSVSDVYLPTTTYTDRHVVTLGSKRVTMTYLGEAHADDSSVLHFPDERAVFSADILQVRRLPGGLAPTVGAWIDALKIVNALDFDHALTGHALAGTKKDAADLLRDLEDISSGVAAGIGAGRSLAEIQKTLTLDAYKGFERWDTTREAHIAAVYATIKGTRVETPRSTR